MENYNNSFVAAISIGSAHITGIVGVKEQDGSIAVHSHIAVPSVDFISKGRVFNPEKMNKALRDIREHLENSVNRKISQMYVGINCMTMRSIPYTNSKNYHEQITITSEVIDQFLTENRQNRQADHTFLETIPLEYRMGTATSSDPIGVMTDSIKVQFLNIVCHANIIDTIKSCFNKVGISIANNNPIGGLTSNLSIATLQIANCITTEQERTGGCAVVDMGCETTTVAVYKGKVLRHLAVIPLGANNITRDIAKVFTCDESEAEMLKNIAGYPDFEKIDDSELIHLREGNRVRKPSELAEIIEARVEEIIQNVKFQIDSTKFNRETLVNGLYITGIGSQLENISQAFETIFKDWQLRQSATPTRLRVKGTEADFNQFGTYNVCLALIDSGEQNCCGGFREEPKSQPENDLFGEAPTEEPLPGVPEVEVEEEKEEEKENKKTEVKKKKEKEEKKSGPSIWSRFKNKLEEILSEDSE